MKFQKFVYVGANKYKYSYDIYFMDNNKSMFVKNMLADNSDMGSFLMSFIALCESLKINAVHNTYLLLKHHGKCFDSKSSFQKYVASTFGDLYARHKNDIIKYQCCIMNTIEREEWVNPHPKPVLKIKRGLFFNNGDNQ